MSDCQSNGGSEAGRLLQVLGKPPELGVEWGVLGLNLGTLFFIKEAVFNLNNVFWGLIG